MNDLRDFVNEKTDRRYLDIDAICINCGAIINSYWENSCVICECGSDNFVADKIAVDIRKLLDKHLEDLKVICVLHDITLGSRYKMVYGITQRLYPSMCGKDKKINEQLIRRMVLRNKRKFWFLTNIENLVRKAEK